jgi:hypothetical protein
MEHDSVPAAEAPDGSEIAGTPASKDLLEPTETQRAVRAAWLGAALGVLLALLGRRSR